MAWKAHRINDGQLVRRGAALALLGLVLFGCRSWYYWQQDLTLELFKTGWDKNWLVLTFKPDMPAELNFGALGALVLFMTGIIATYYVIYVNGRTADFLIETESELRKVTWPAYKPWFRMKAEMWGASYVVIFVLLMLAGIIFTWDQILIFLARQAFYS